MRTSSLAALILLLLASGAAHAQRHATGDAARKAPEPPASQDQEFQPPQLPPLEPGMTLAMILHGDTLFHSRAGCFACHGAEAQGLPAAGSALTRGVRFIPVKWSAMDSLIAAGIPEGVTRSPIHMPPRGGRGDLTPGEIRDVAAYVWAISQTKGEPWPGGHTGHASMVPAGSTSGTSTTRRWRAETTPERTLPEPRGTTKER